MADYPCAMYSDCTEFFCSPKPTVSQLVQENYFPHSEMPQNGTFVGVGVGFLM